MRNIEAIFAGFLALAVLGVAIFVTMKPSFPGGPGGNPVLPGPPSAGGYEPPRPDPVRDDITCQCFRQAFELAGQDVGVMSSQYRTGFESCRAAGDVLGGEAWTAGWNARLSAKPFQASCSAWLRDRGRGRGI